MNKFCLDFQIKVSLVSFRLYATNEIWLLGRKYLNLNEVPSDKKRFVPIFFASPFKTIVRHFKRHWTVISVFSHQEKNTLAVATGLEKVSFHSNPKERQCQRMFKLLHNALISHASKVMLKILQARLQQYLNQELPDVQAGFRKSRGTRDQIANICWIIEKPREF